MSNNSQNDILHKPKKRKLTKQEKRMLKFAVQRGATVDDVQDLKGWLATQTEKQKKHGAVGSASGGAKQVKKGMLKVGDYT